MFHSAKKAIVLVLVSLGSVDMSAPISFIADWGFTLGEPLIDFFSLFVPMIQASVATIHSLGDLLNYLVGYASLASLNKPLLLKNHIAVSKAYSFSNRDGSFITSGLPISAANALTLL